MTQYVKMDDIMQFPIRRYNYDRANGNGHFINGIETVMEYIETLPRINVEEVQAAKLVDWEIYDNFPHEELMKILPSELAGDIARYLIECHVMHIEEWEDRQMHARGVKVTVKFVVPDFEKDEERGKNNG